MQKNLKISLLAVPLIATTLISSCIVPGFENDWRSASNRGGYQVYNVLPDAYYGDAYYYNGRYYTGGDYQSGRYSYNGRQYTSRYLHNGTYMYGGRYFNHDNRRQDDPRHDTYRNRDGYRR